MASEVSWQALLDGSASRVEKLRERLRGLGSALVAYSGGVDSAFVLGIACEVLADRVVALTAVSPSVAPSELAEARALARRLGARHVEVDAHELDNPSYASNPVNRCYFCKTELYTLCEAQRVELGLAAVLDGLNADDLRDHRPGATAAREHAVLSPLAEQGLTKDEVRAWSQKLGLPTWDKPAAPCLASRFPYGTAVTRDRLLQVGAAEADLRRLGLSVFRVRFHDEIARVELAAEEYPRFESAEFRREVDRALKAHGFKFVVLDLEPFRSGRLNEAAQIAQRVEPVGAAGS